MRNYEAEEYRRGYNAGIEAATVHATLTYEKAYTWYRCTNCKAIFPARVLECFDDCEYKPRFRFCPNCGAIIDRKEGKNET